MLSKLCKLILIVCITCIILLPVSVVFGSVVASCVALLGLIYIFDEDID